MGRNQEYDESVFQEILDRLAAGEMLNAICESDPKFPADRTVRRWIYEDKPTGISDRYTRAREMGMHVLVEQCIRISDDGSNDTIFSEEGPKPDHEWMARSRLRVDTRKWLASKVIPKIYGDKVTQQIEGADGKPLTIHVHRGSPPKNAGP